MSKEGRYLPNPNGFIAAHNKAKQEQLRADVDQDAFVFTARLKALCDEFDERITLATAIGAMEVVKHELITGALEQDHD